ELGGRLEMLVEVPHLAANLPSGAIIAPGDIEMRLVPAAFADSGAVTAAEQVVGKQLRRPARAGLMLRPSDVAEPLLVSRNDTVTLYFRQGPMTLTVKGQALADAAEGQTVSVLNLMSSRIVSGTAIGA